MLKLAALVSGLGWHVQDLRRAAKGLDISLAALPFPTITGRVGDDGARVEAGGIDLTGLDGILVRMMPPGSLEQVVFRMDALHRLEAIGVPVLNPPRAVEAAVDKYLALARLEADGLPVPATWVGESADDALAAFERLGRDVVVKPLFGSEGRGLVRVSDLELARRTFHTLARLGTVLYVQRFVRHPGYDLRAFVLRDRVIGAIRRDASGGDWRTNVAVGGTARKVELGAEIESVAIRAANAVGARMAGVDLLPDADDDGLTVIEVNAVP
ncbi:MAG TPA: RimK family alpha-L-glutamate ligase [Isosphaeraceae bacterium]